MNFLIFLFSISQKQDLLYISDKILVSIQKGDFKEVMNYGSKSGIIFSIDAYVDSLDPKIPINKFKTILKDTTKLFWGYYPSGKEIYMTFNEFYQKYLKKNYLKGKKSKNKVIGVSNTKNNISEFFKNAEFVEYYIKGNNEYDWHSLRLVFVNKTLVAIIHDSWSP